MLGGTRVLDRLTLSIPRRRAHGHPRAERRRQVDLHQAADAAAVSRRRARRRRPSSAKRRPIRVFGQDRWDVFELRSQLGIVSADLHDRFVHGNSNGVLTGLDAVVSGFFATHGVFAHQRVTEAMRRAGDGGARARRCRRGWRRATLDTMSTGEARRVLIARALVHQPAALVLDEPTRGLDLVSRHHFMERVRAVAREGTTILLVTHHVDEIIPEIARVILLRRGRIACDGAKARRPDRSAPRVTPSTRRSSVEQDGGYFHVRVSGDQALSSETLGLHSR